MSKTRISIRCLVLAVCGIAVSLLAANVDAAQIQLRRQAAATGAVVRLGDIADIYQGDEQDLRAIELFPAPGAGGVKTLRLADVQNLLSRRGISLVAHRFSGSSVVAIRGSIQHAAGSARAKSASASRAALNKSRQKLNGAIVRYLDGQSGRPGSWDAVVELNAEDAVTLVGAQQLAITSDSPSREGRQQFRVSATTEHGPTELMVTAEVTAGRRIVVATRAIPRGVLVTRADVQLTSLGSRHRGVNPATMLASFDEVIGRQTTRPVRAGQPLTARLVKRPVLVKRGDAVSVVVRRGGVTVTTTARATQEGSLDDLIICQSLADRKRQFTARVVGPGEVGIFPHTVSAGPVRLLR